MRNNNTHSCLRSMRSLLFAAIPVLSAVACGTDDSPDVLSPGLDAAVGGEAGLSPVLGAEAGVAAEASVGPIAGFGASCESSACPTGLRCAMPSSCPGFSCPKVCVRDTADCVADPCGANAYCATNFGSASGTCEPRVAQGEACGMPPGGDPDINTCADGLYCSADDGTRETCIPALAARATCPFTLWLGTARQACVKGFTCADPTNSVDATCVPVKNSGETCLNSTECAEGLRCTAQKCAPGRAGSAVR